MVPFVVMGGLAGVIAWAVRPKNTGVVSDGIGAAPKALPPIVLRDSQAPPGFSGGRLLPEEERLLSLLVLWAKDKRFPRGRKRYTSKVLIVDLAKLCRRLGLNRTARAVLRDGPLPREPMGRRGVTVRDAVLAYLRRR